MPTPPTCAQHQVLEFIRHHLTAAGYSPSFREIADGLELKSLSTVAKHVDGLESRGWIRRIHSASLYGNAKSRSIQLVAGLCPTCGQKIKPTVLPPSSEVG